MDNNMFAGISKWRKSLMGLSALWIWMFHCWSPLLSETPLAFYEKFFVQVGFCGVDIFLFLSGMGLVRSIKKGTLTFYLSRLKRVYVPFLIASIFLSVLSFHWDLIEFIKRVTPYYFYTESIYKYLWFVPAILSFYLLFPLYWFIYGKSKSKLAFTLTVLFVWLALSFYGRGLLRPDLWGFTNRIPIFVIGIYLGDLSLSRDFTWKRTYYTMFLAMLFTGAYASHITGNRGFFLIVPTSDCFLPNVLMTISLTFLLSRLFEVLATLRARKFKHSVFHAVVGFFGTVSLEFYCLQEEFRGLFTGLLTPYMNEPLARLIVFVITAVAAYLVYLISKLIFKPFELLKKKPGDR